MAIVSKIWKEPMTDVTSTKTNTGRSSGTVTCQKVWTSDAPSMDAAS